MNNHEYFLELINLKTDNMLTAEQESELDGHLKGCSECADRLRMYELIHDFSEELLVSPPEGFTSDVMDKIRSNTIIKSPKRRIASRIITAVGAAAVLALVLYTGVYEYIFPKDNETSVLTAMDKAEYISGVKVDEDQQISATSGEDTGTNSSVNDSSSVLPKDTADSNGSSDESGAAHKDNKKTDLFASGAAMPEVGSNLFDTSTAEIGDEVAGFIITDIDADYNDDDSSVHVVFQGEATLSGTLYHDNNELGHWGKFIYFYIDDDCSEFLPYPDDDDRQIWFGFDNYDEAVKMLDTQPGDEGVTIAYQAVIVIDNYTVMQGATEGCNFATLKSVLTLNRLDD